MNSEMSCLQIFLLKKEGIEPKLLRENLWGQYLSSVSGSEESLKILGVNQILCYISSFLIHSVINRQCWCKCKCKSGVLLINNKNNLVTSNYIVEITLAISFADYYCSFYLPMFLVRIISLFPSR